MFGVKLPLSGPAQPNPSSTLTASIAFSNVVGLQQIAVGLSGSWTAGQMASKIGLTWPLADDLFILSAPRLAWTLAPASLMAETLVDIPALGVSKTLASLAVQPGGGFQLQVSPGGACWSAVGRCSRLQACSRLGLVVARQCQLPARLCAQL